VLVEIHDMQLGVRAVADERDRRVPRPRAGHTPVGSGNESEGELGGTALHVFGFI